MLVKEANVCEIYEKYQKKLKREHVKSLQEWLEKQPHLPKFKEIYLIQFLHCANYNNEKAKLMIDSFSSIWSHFPEIFQKRNPHQIKHIFDTLSIILLPKLTPDNCHVILIRTLTTDSSKYTIEVALQYLDMFISMHKEWIGLSPGQVIVIDSSNYNFSFITKTNIITVKKFLHYIQNGLPVVLKGVHMINVNPAIEKILTLCKPFIKNELFKLLHIHSKPEELYNYIPQDCFPIEYKGSTYSVDKLHEDQIQTMLENADFFKNENFLVDETKRPGKPKNECDIFGIEGTFKKLDID